MGVPEGEPDRDEALLGAVVQVASVAVTSLIAFNVIPATLPVALGFGAALLVLDRLGWRVTSGHLRPRTTHHRHQVTLCWARAPARRHAR